MQHYTSGAGLRVAEPVSLKQNACGVVQLAESRIGQFISHKRRTSASVVACLDSLNAPIIGDEDVMNTIRLIAIALIVAGVLGLVYGGFSYTKDTTAFKLGPIELSVKEKQTVNVPMWAGIGAIVMGGLLLVLGNKKG